ncbi:MAG: ferritin-like domain-containing protein, partial [Stellaceae bacterium]
YYAALGEAADEPVLKSICRHIAADEIRHYKLFHRNLERYLAIERLTRWGRLKVALSRIRETADDELAYAYHVANGAGAYDRRRAARAYARAASAIYRRHHAAQLVRLSLKATGLGRGGVIERAATALAWWSLRRRSRAA